MKSILKCTFSIIAFIWAVYPVEVGESDEAILEYINSADSDSSENEIEIVSEFSSLVTYSSNQ